METRASYVLIGGFIVALMLALVGFAMWLAGAGVGEERQQYYVYFTGSVTGLAEGSPVRRRGVPFGNVLDIRIDPDDVGRVRVTLETPADPPIKSDAQALLELQGLTGAAFIQITGGSQTAPDLLPSRDTPIPVIPAKDSAFADLLEGAPRLLGELISLAENANKVLSVENQQALTDTLANIAQFSETLAAQSATLDSTLTNADALLAEVRVYLDQLNQTLEDEIFILSDEVSQTTQSFRQTARSITETSDELRGILAENRTALRDFSGQGLYEASLLLSELRDLVSNLNAVTSRIERDPRDFLFRGSGSGVSVD